MEAAIFRSDGAWTGPGMGNDEMHSMVLAFWFWTRIHVSIAMLWYFRVLIMVHGLHGLYASTPRRFAIQLGWYLCATTFASLITD